MKITQLMLSKGFGGAERYFVDLTLALAQQGHELQAVHHKHFVQRRQLTSQARIQTVAANVWGKWDLLAQKQIQTEIADFAPDVIHGHLARGAYFGGKAGHALNIPVTVKTHNYVNLKYYRDVDRFIATTEDQCRYLVENGIAENRVQVIPNFSNLPFVNEVPPALNEAPVFVSCGRLVRKKGYDLLIKAFHQYLQQGQSAGLIIGGDGPELKPLKQQVKALGLSEQVSFTGWIDNVAELLDRGDIFVLPSRDEPFGIVVLEAMARGKTIVSTLSKGPREILNQDSAYLVPVGDETALGLALGEAAADIHHNQSKAIRALQVFKERYSQQAVVPQIEALYRQLQAH